MLHNVKCYYTRMSLAGSQSVDTLKFHLLLTSVVKGLVTLSYKAILVPFPVIKSRYLMQSRDEKYIHWAFLETKIREIVHLAFFFFN